MWLYLTQVIFISALVLLSLFLYWSLYPYKTIEIKDIRLIDKEIGSTELLGLEIDYCKYIDRKAVVERVFEDGLYFPGSPIESNEPKGCRTVVRYMDVPKCLLNGQYRLKLRWTYDVNPVRDISVEEYTDYFNVID